MISKANSFLEFAFFLGRHTDWKNPTIFPIRVKIVALGIVGARSGHRSEQSERGGWSDSGTPKSPTRKDGIARSMRNKVSSEPGNDRLEGNAQEIVY